LWQSVGHQLTEVLHCLLKIGIKSRLKADLISDEKFSTVSAPAGFVELPGMMQGTLKTT